MEVVSTAMIGIVKMIDTERRYCKDTFGIYERAATFMAQVFNKHYGYLSHIDKDQHRKTAMDQLIHKTKKNPAPDYPEFDMLFYKMPAYLRRAARDAAWGAVCSYQTNLEKWMMEKQKAEAKGHKFYKKPPSFPKTVGQFPVFFQDGDSVCQWSSDKHEVRLKLYADHDWKFVTIHLKPTDIGHFVKKMDEVGGKPSSVSLIYSYGAFKLAIPYKVGNPLVEIGKPVFKICSVDLGINNDAVCSIMDLSGTITARHFVNAAPGIKDLMDRLLNKMKGMQKNGAVSVSHAWTKVDGLRDELTRLVADGIVSFAYLNGASVIVFEYLGKMKPHGPAKQKIALWNKQEIYKLCAHRAHKAGLRVGRIDPKNTSRLAFDGSGEVKRDKDNYSLCTFRTGKRYNCDLSASYNIGARYILRFLKKSMNESEWSRIQAKVPEAGVRTNWTYSTLLAVLAERGCDEKCEA